MELLLLALIVLGAGRSSSSDTGGMQRVAGVRRTVLDQRVATPLRKPSPYVNNFGTRSKDPDAPPAPAGTNPETGKPEINWAQAGLNCLQNALPGAAAGAGAGAVAGGVGAGPGALAGGLLACGGGILHEIVNPTGRS